MDTIETKDCAFEMGPIRPPSEAGSILLRLTRNCPWNKCAFCHSYKGEKFSLRSVDEIKSDIDAIHAIAKKIMEISKENSTQITDRYLLSRLSMEEHVSEYYVRQVAFWLYHGMESLFFQDADSLVMKTDQVIEILNYLKEKFPAIKRITTYARAKTVSRKSPEELKKIRQAGLSRIHIGLESGSDTVLKLINKGVTAEEQVRAGRNAIEAGFELSEYYMPGAGGAEDWKENALESARVLNEINPTFIRLRSAVPLPETPLYRLFKEKKWTPLTEEEKVMEIKLFIETLGAITSTIKSDHMMNLLEDVEGTLPGERDKIMAPVNRFMSLTRDEKESFIIGRRIGKYRTVADFRPLDDVEAVKVKLLQNYASLDDAIREILWNFI